MSNFRFIFDDYGQSTTQTIVLREYARALTNSYGVNTIWSSELPDLESWVEVPQESSRRLRLRTLALAPEPGLHTVFFPGHIVPGALASPREIKSDLALALNVNIAKLDLFVANNGSDGPLLVRELVTESDEYNRLSEFKISSVTNLPSWLSVDNVYSCLQLSQRPWYSANSPMRGRWTKLVKELIQNEKLDLSIVSRDIEAGLIRPSCHSDIVDLLESKPLSLDFSCGADSVFICPEIQLSDSQYNLLTSKQLQDRLVAFSKSKKNGYKNKYSARKPVNMLTRISRFVAGGAPVDHKIYALMKNKLKRAFRTIYKTIRKIPRLVYKTYEAALRLFKIYK